MRTVHNTWGQGTTAKLKRFASRCDQRGEAGRVCSRRLPRERASGSRHRIAAGEPKSREQGGRGATSPREVLLPLQTASIRLTVSIGSTGNREEMYIYDGNHRRLDVRLGEQKESIERIDERCHGARDGDHVADARCRSLMDIRLPDSPLYIYIR